jgi:hypothetical protein
MSHNKTIEILTSIKEKSVVSLKLIEGGKKQDCLELKVSTKQAQLVLFTCLRLLREIADLPPDFPSEQ